MPEEALSLSHAIQTLRDELAAAQASGKESSLHFLIEDITLDLQLVATVKGGVKGKIGWSLFGVEAGADASHASTHRIQLKMKLAPDSAGHNPQISDEVEMD
jgi:hypothetical protein